MSKLIKTMILIDDSGRPYVRSLASGCSCPVEIQERLIVPLLEDSKLFDYAEIAKMGDPDYSAFVSEQLK